MTGSPASSFSASNDSVSSSPDSYFSKSIIYPHSASPITTIDYSHFSPPITKSRAIPIKSNTDISTPPLTPDDDSDYGGRGPGPVINTKKEKDALDFLMTLFPRQGLGALPYAKSVAISAPNMGAAFGGVVLELPGQLKTLYVDGKSAESVSLRERYALMIFTFIFKEKTLLIACYSIVALLDLADESLECAALVIVLERSSPNLGDLLHSLMYVGGTVVTKPPFQLDSAFVLVGLEI